ncbi:MurR/RpiR family transcriptional regulator [Clostridium bowmanii]|uniref:MurR/RpiR family transcriptional regulator n=1 Tax=Clostridium bowmanii TaxID=132925 RepID=UPI001C0E60F4|nr:MurR/RpiR family transcriptional regulator [Clostridium bowmanii]MBU3190024.1 MurR/RpiR family transcriptional regulator [Clostridium bowmanii]MCA1074539.1 MurR/RpiR family transcriptional regulator [Clostridium bowmanii]
MMNDIGGIESLRNIYSELKGAEKRVGEYILKNSKDIIHSSITELAENCKCGEATVFRLSKKLGFKGYQDLKISIASEIVKPLVNIHEEIKENDDSLVIMQKIFNSTISSLNETLRINDNKELDKAIGYIHSAKRIAFFGMGGSAAIALDAYHKFMRTGKYCAFHEDSHFQAMVSAMYDENDCIIAISNTGSNKELVENLQIAKENGVKIISITSNYKSPILKVSDVVLVSYGKENLSKSEAMDSRISALTLIDCMFVGTCLKDKENYYKALGQIREGIAIKRY